MSTGITKSQNEVHEGEKGVLRSKKGENIDTLYPEVLVNPGLFGDAVDGESHEHEMGLLAAIKSHPRACLWAFTMCFTIVSLP